MRRGRSVEEFINLRMTIHAAFLQLLWNLMSMDPVAQSTSIKQVDQLAWLIHLSHYPELIPLLESEALNFLADVLE